MNLRYPYDVMTRLAVAGAFLVGLGVSVPLVAQESPIHIELRSQVEVKVPRVTLGDIALLHSRDAKAVSRLKALPLGNAPRAGGSINLGRSSLEHWICARTGLEAERIQWSGPRSSSIHLATQNASGDQIAKSALAFLHHAFEATGLRTEIGLAQTPENISIPAGRLELKARPQVALQPPSLAGEPYLKTPTSPLLSKRQCVWIDVWVDEQFIRTIPVNFDVSVYAPAYVASEDMAASQVIDLRKAKIREVEWSGRTALPLRAKFDTAEVLPALRLRRPVTAGEVLTQTQVEPAPLVIQGAYATLHAFQGPIEVESRVEVLQDGFMGQLVKVKMLNASSAFQARVAGPGRVEVRE